MSSISSPRCPGTSLIRSRSRWIPFIALVAATVLLVTVYPMRGEAATSPTLGTAESYSVIAGSIVTNTGPTSLAGDLGISPGIGVAPHYSGFPPGVVLGTIHDGDAIALTAQAGNTAAFGVLDQGCDVTYPGVQDLTLVSPLVAGVYCADAFLLTGNLTLSGAGVWIFKSASTLTTSSNSSVTGGDPCNVWWRLGSSGTLGSGTSFIGNILALTSISLNTGALVNGRLLAQTGAVTLQSNIITGPICAQLPTNTPTPTNTTVPGATNTPIPTSTNTAVATNTSVPGATNTPVPTSTNTPVATNTSVPGATNTPTPTNTVAPNATNTATPTMTNTPISGVSSTATATRTSTRTPANTPVPENTIFNQPQPQPFILPPVAPPIFIIPAPIVPQPPVGQPPQSEVVIAPPAVVTQAPPAAVVPPTGVGLPPQSPLFLPPSAGDGGLIQPEKSGGIESAVGILLVFVSMPVLLALLARRGLKR